MTKMEFDNYIKYSFWGNVEYPTNDAAKHTRDAFAKQLKSEGFKVRKSVLRDQLRPYSGLNQPDGRVGNVYLLVAIRNS